MTNFSGIPLISLRENSITHLDLKQKGGGVPGAIGLSKLLPSAVALKSLKCAAATQMFALVSAPVDTHFPLTIPSLPFACSLEDNNIGAEGAFTLAATLTDTKIANLGCAAAP